MLNEFTDNEMACEKELDPMKSCNPLGDFNSPNSLEYSLAAMGVIWVFFKFISFLCMKRLTRKYE